MWLGDQYRAWQASRAQRYLTRHPALGLDVLRRDHELAARAFETFTESQAANGKDGPQRESYAYPIFSTMGFGGQSSIVRTLPKPTPYNIRMFSNHPPARRAINVLENPILELPFTISVRRPVGMKAHDTQPDPTEEQHQRIVAATEMFMQPNDEQDGREFLEMVLEDLICLGAGPFEAVENTSDVRPLFLWPVDAQSIRLNVRWKPDTDDYRYSQGRGFLFGTVGTSEEVKFGDLQLCYPKLNPRTSTPFGYGYLETAFDTVNAFLGAISYAERRASNMTPTFGLFLGENMTPEQVRIFQHYWENEIEGRGKVPILGGGRQPTPFAFTGTGKDQLWLAWQEWLVRIIAMAFGVSPMRLGLERDVNKSTAAQGAQDDWSTIAPVANTVRNSFTHWILWKRLGWRDLEFQWQVKSSDELRQATILAQQYMMNAITVDEIRQVYERPPLEDGLGDMVRSAFEAAIAAASGAAAPGEENMQQDLVKPPRISAMTPFADEVEDDTLSASETAFLRALMQEARYGDLEDVAG